MEKKEILIIGNGCSFMKGLTIALMDKYGPFGVVTAGKTGADILMNIGNRRELEEVLRVNAIRQIYLLDGLPEAERAASEDHNTNFPLKSLPDILNAAVKYRVEKVVWAGSITLSADGASGTGQYIDYWCNFYIQKFGLDIRGLRFPFILSPGSGHAFGDYVEDACRHALEQRLYTSFLAEDTCLPWIFLQDALRAVLELTDVPKERIKVSTGYHLNGMAFAPCDLAAEISRQLPGFEIAFAPDRRDHLARQLAGTLRDNAASKDWDWKPDHNLERTVAAIVRKLIAEKGQTLSSGAPGQLYEFYPHETF
jgi:threonine 3-dehydrogenase